MSKMNKPVISLRDGQLQASVWVNESEHGQFYTTDVVKSYLVSNDEWRKTTSFAGSEALRAANLLSNAYNQALALKE